MTYQKNAWSGPTLSTGIVVRHRRYMMEWSSSAIAVTSSTALTPKPESHIGPTASKATSGVPHSWQTGECTWELGKAICGLSEPQSRRRFSPRSTWAIRLARRPSQPTAHSTLQRSLGSTPCGRISRIGLPARRGRVGLGGVSTLSSLVSTRFGSSRRWRKHQRLGSRRMDGSRVLAEERPSATKLRTLCKSLITGISGDGRIAIKRELEGRR